MGIFIKYILAGTMDQTIQQKLQDQILMRPRDFPEYCWSTEVMTLDPKAEQTLECDELWGNVQAKCEQNPTKKWCERALEGYQAVLDGTIEELRQQRKENRQNREN